MSKIEVKTERRTEIAGKALPLFVEKGYAGTTVPDIADGLGISKEELFKCYATKEELFIDSLIALYDDFKKEILADITAAAGPVDKLKVLFNNSMDIMLKMKEYYGIFMESMELFFKAPMAGNLQEFTDTELAYFYKLTEDILAEGIDRGIFRGDIDKEALGVYLVSSLDGVGLHYFIQQKTYDVPRVCGAFLDSFIRGISV